MKMVSYSRWSLNGGSIRFFPKRQILDTSKQKEVADDNFKFDAIDRKFFKQMENTVGKGKIVSSFSFSNSVFKRLVMQTCKNQGLFMRMLRRGVVLEQ